MKLSEILIKPILTEKANGQQQDKAFQIHFQEQQFGACRKLVAFSKMELIGRLAGVDGLVEYGRHLAQFHSFFAKKHRHPFRSG